MRGERARVLFRTAGGMKEGLGHVRRCLSLAVALARGGCEVLFRVHGADGVGDIVRAEGFGVDTLASVDQAGETAQAARRFGARCVVVDSYDFDTAFFDKLADEGLITVVIDDLLRQDLSVDVLVNSALGVTADDYQSARRTRRVIAGSSFALLRPEFAAPPRRDYGPSICRVLITAGGSDPTRVTDHLVEAAIARGVRHVDVVVGPFGEADIEGSADDAPGSVVTYYRSPADVRALMLASDLALCAGGQTLYELAATATPAIAVQTACNQTRNLEAFAAHGIVAWVGGSKNPSLVANVKSALGRLAPDRAARRNMGEKGRAVVDGRGAERVARVIGELLEASC